MGFRHRLVENYQIFKPLFKTIDYITIYVLPSNEIKFSRFEIGTKFELLIFKYR